MITAKEFLKEKYTLLYEKMPDEFKNKIQLKSYLSISVEGRVNGVEANIVDFVIEFARICCIEQVRVISEKATVTNHIPNKDDDRVYKIVDKDSILKAFDLDSIK